MPTIRIPAHPRSLTNVGDLKFNKSRSSSRKSMNLS